MANCTKCGAPLREGAKFCGACGAKVEVQRFCTECGEKLEPGEKFCSYCGTPAEGAPRASAPPVKRAPAPRAAAAPAKRAPTPPAAPVKFPEAGIPYDGDHEVEDHPGGCRIKKYNGK